MQLFDDQDEPLVLDRLVGRLERLAAAQLFQHVVNLGHREVRMLGLPRLAQGVEFLGDCANARFQRRRADRETGRGRRRATSSIADRCQRRANRRPATPKRRERARKEHRGNSRHRNPAQTSMLSGKMLRSRNWNTRCLLVSGVAMYRGRSAVNPRIKVFLRPNSHQFVRL